MNVTFVFPFAGIVYSCYMGLGFGTGSIIAGFLMDIFGGSRTFLIFGGATVIMICLLLVAMAITKLLERRENGNEKESETDDNDWT